MGTDFEVCTAIPAAGMCPAAAAGRDSGVKTRYSTGDALPQTTGQIGPLGEYLKPAAGGAVCL
jgi:hypothetical protein